MTADQILALAVARRTAAGLGLAVYGLADRPADEPFTCYAKDAEQAQKWRLRYEAKGCRVETIGA